MTDLVWSRYAVTLKNELSQEAELFHTRIHVTISGAQRAVL